MKTNLTFIMIALITLAITACSPEDGKDGKDGVDGIQGIPGQDGVDGEQGIPGQDGNANVTSYLFKNLIFDIGLSEPLPIPALTQDILDNGVVLGYIRPIDNTIWYSLPYLDGDDYLNIYALNLGSLYLSSTFTTYYLDVRIIVIKGNAGTGGKSNEGNGSSQLIIENLKEAGVDIDNYEDVSAYYHLKN